MKILILKDKKSKMKLPKKLIHRLISKSQFNYNIYYIIKFYTKILNNQVEM